MKIKSILPLVLSCAFIFSSLSLSIPNAEASNVNRIYGSDRYQTAVEISKYRYNSSKTAFIASGETFADAIVSGSVAISVDAPILLVKKYEIPKFTSQELSRLGVKKIYLVGGDATISTRVLNELKTKYPNTERISGGDRYSTSEKLAELKTRLFPSESGNFITGQVVGNLYFQALSASTVMGKKHALLYLTPSFDGTTAYAFGRGRTRPGINMNSYKVWYDGLDRYHVATQCANSLIDDIVNVQHRDVVRIFIASGESVPDALCASILTASNDSILLLTPKNEVYSEIYNLAWQNQVVDITIIGGENTITSSVENKLKKYDIYSDF